MMKNKVTTRLITAAVTAAVYVAVTSTNWAAVLTLVSLAGIVLIVKGFLSLLDWSMLQEQFDIAEEDIKTLEMLVHYVKNNTHKEWCKGIDVDSCNSKIKFYKASLKDTIYALAYLDELP